MAIKDWISKFATGVGLDDTSAGGMETLLGLVDETRVSQPHALRDSLIEVEKQVFGAPWFEWNGADLLQFDSEVDGANVTDSTWSVVSFLGLSWISASVTSSGGSSGIDTLSILPITTAPPSADYVVVADYINTTSPGSGVISAGVVARFDGTDTTYQVHRQNTTNQSRMEVLLSGVYQGAQGPDITEPSVTAGNDDGTRLILRVEGQTLLSQAGSGGIWSYVSDTAGSITAAGQAGLSCGTNVTNGTCVNLFRRVRCYTLVD